MGVVAQLAILESAMEQGLPLVALFEDDLMLTSTPEVARERVCSCFKPVHLSSRVDAGGGTSAAGGAGRPASERGRALLGVLLRRLPGPSLPPRCATACARLVAGVCSGDGLYVKGGAACAGVVPAGVSRHGCDAPGAHPQGHAGGLCHDAAGISPRCGLGAGCRFDDARAADSHPAGEWDLSAILPAAGLSRFRKTCQQSRPLRALPITPLPLVDRE